MTVSPQTVPGKSIDRIDAALAAILAIAPLLPSGPTYFGWRTASYGELVVPALLVLWAIACVGARGRPRQDLPMPTRPWNLFAAAMAGAAVHGAMADNLVTSPVFVERVREAADEWFLPMNQAVHPLYSLRVGLTFLEGWLVFRLVVGICRMARDPGHRARIALGGWLAGFAVVSAWALVQYATRLNLHPYWVKANPLLVRSHATLDDPNTLGACLVLVIGLMAGLLWLDASPRRLIWLVSLALASAGLFTTMSRAALGGAILATLAVLAIGPMPATALQRAVRTVSRIAVGLLLTAVVSSIVLRAVTTEHLRTKPDSAIDSIVKTFDPRESTGWILRGRVPWWRAGVSMFREAPIAGVGLGRYPRVMGSHGGGKVPENTHNLFLQFLAESGIVGFSCFVVLCAALCRWLTRATRATASAGTAADATACAVALGGLIGVTGFLVTLLTGHALLAPSGQLVFASFAGVVVMMAMPRPGSPSLVGEPRRARRAGFTLAYLGAAAIGPTAAIAGGVTPVFGAWGYHAGLYNEEQSGDGSRYRWTTGRALLDLPVPRPARAIVVDLAPVRPVRDGVPVVARLSVDGTATEVRLPSAGRNTVRLALRQDAGSRVVLQIQVTPTFVPAAAGGEDHRVLGVQLFMPQFETAAR